MDHQPAAASSAIAALRDGLLAIKIAAMSSSTKVFRAWVLVPAGLTGMLAVCFAIDTLLRRLGVTFPASVAGLLLLFVGLLASEAALGSHRTRKFVAVIDVPAGWSLRWISVFFTPSFVLLPLSPPIGVVEVFKIIAVFLIGFFVMMALVAYLTRGLQLLFGSSKRALAQRAEELGDQNGNSSNRSSTEGIPLAENASVAGTATPGVASAAPSRPQTPPQLRLQDHHHNHGHVAESLLDLASQGQQQQPAQAPIPTLRADRWAAILVAHADVATFAALFLFVGLPVYYAAGYAMPAHLALTVLAYMAAMAVPASWRQFLHPVLVSSLFTVLGVWALSALRPLPDDSLTSALLAYRTGSKYLRLWEAASSSSSSDAIPPPGAGDVFGSLLDAAIVALALPMFQYRRELRAHALALTIPSLLTSLGSVVAYPPLCHAVGIAPERALAFSARSLTLALAAPAVANLGGDSNTVAALAILSGILGVLCGNRLLALLRVPDDDYVTRGVTLGINSSAIATALLLRTDPRAAALSSLSMSLFGAVTVLFTSIPPAAHLVRSFVGL